MMNQLQKLLLTTIVFLFIFSLPSILKAQFNIKVSSTRSECSATGSISIEVEGGTAPYCYNLSPCINCYTCLNQKSYTYSSLQAGTYEVTVTDNSVPANTKTATIVVEGNYSTPDLSANANGCILTAVVKGGKSPFRFAISYDGGTTYGNYQSDSVFVGVKGAYCLKVIDSCDNFTTYCSELNYTKIQIRTICDTLFSNNEMRIITNLVPTAKGTLPYKRYFFTSGADTIDFSYLQIGYVVVLPLRCSWTAHVIDACGDISSSTESCYKYDVKVKCHDCTNKTTTFDVTEGIPPFKFYYYTFDPSILTPNSNGIDNPYFSNLPDFTNTTYRIIDSCDHYIDIKPECLKVEIKIDCDSNITRLLPNIFYSEKLTYTCESCSPKQVVFDRYGIFYGIQHPATFSISDSCGNYILIKENPFELNVWRGDCQTILSSVTCEDPMQELLNGTYKIYNSKDSLIGQSNKGFFTNLKSGVYKIEYYCPTYGTFTKTFELKKADIRLSSTITSRLDSNKCTPVHFIKITTYSECEIIDLETGISNKILYVSIAGSYLSRAYLEGGKSYRIVAGPCEDTTIYLPKIEFDLNFIPPICPTDGNIVLKGAKTKKYWEEWGKTNSKIPIINKGNDFYTLDCVFSQSAPLKCPIDSSGVFNNKTPGNTYTAYLYLNYELIGQKGISFWGPLCPVDTLSFVFKPENYQKMDSIKVNYISCLGKDGIMSIQIDKGTPPYTAKVMDCTTKNILFDTITQSKSILIDRLKTGTYCFQFVDGCGNSLDFQKSVVAPPDFFVQSSIGNCDSSVINLQSTTFEGATYTWRSLSSGNIIEEGVNTWLSKYKLNSQTDIIQLQIEYNNCILFQDTISVSKPPIPDFTLVPLPIRNCKGALTFVPSSIESPYTKFWNTNSTTDTLSNLTSGKYALKVVDRNGCTKEKDITIAIPTLEIDITESKSNCKSNLSVSLLQGKLPLQYLWNNNSTSPNQNDIINENFGLTVTDANGCETKDTIQIRNKSPKLGYEKAPAQNCLEGAILRVSDGNPPYSFYWNDNFSTTDTFRYTLIGTYQVVAIDKSGCRDTLSVIVGDTSTFASFKIYNGISPNEDQKNDRFYIQGIEKYPDNEVVIYNRWGNQVYRKVNYTNETGWDGSYQDVPIPDGTYFYYIYLKCSGQEKVGFLEVRR